MGRLSVYDVKNPRLAPCTSHFLLGLARNECVIVNSNEMLKPEPFKRVRLGHVLFHAATEAETVAHIANALGSQRGGTIVTVNLDHLLRCKRFVEYRAIVERADLVVADGQPKILGQSHPRFPFTRTCGWFVSVPFPGLAIGSGT